jgi:LmbE family N-acetylglucosaminyl deacetylase
MKVDILVFAVHPDDAELSCSGTILKHIELGRKVAIVDFTAGELGTRGTAEIRLKEANDSKIFYLFVQEKI